MSVYMQGKLSSVRRSTYDNNHRGDGIKRHYSIWTVGFPEFTPAHEYYREITYYGEDGR